MKILFVIPYYVPAYSYGGPVKVAHDLAKAFVQKGHSVTVATTDVYDAHSRNKVKNEIIDGVKIVRFRNLSNYLAKNFNGYLPFGFRKWIKNNLKNYDIVHCHDFFTYQNIVVSRYCKKYSVPFVVQPHGCLDSIRVKAKSSKLKVLFLKFFPILQNAKAVIALTEYEKASIASVILARPESAPQEKKDSGQARKTKNKIHIIPNGIDLSEFQNIQNIDLHKKYNIPKNNKIISFLGRVQYIKGLDISLKALAKIKDKIDFSFLIVGPDEGEKGKLELLAKELKIEKNVIFTGILTGKDKLNTLTSADLFLFNSRSEGFGMTIIEACACNLPVIISDNCPIPEIETMQAGIITKNNPEEISQNLLKVLTDSNLLNTYKKNTIKVAEYYSLESSFQKMLKLYKETI